MNEQDKKQKVEFPVLGIDYGEKRIGIAVSDNKGIIASPLKHIVVSPKSGLKGTLTLLELIIDEWRVKTIILGRPQKENPIEKTNKKDKKGTIQEKIEKYRKLLSDNTDIPIFYYDESFSTKRAEKIIREGGSNIKSAKGKIDSIASAVMLQEFLNNLKK